MFRAPTVTSCLGLIMSEIPQVFPNLRWGFIEASSQWVPWIYLESENRYQAAGREFPKDLFEEYGIYVTCQTNDDIPYVLKYSGEGNLVIGTDYGHTDPSSEMDAILDLKKMDDVSQERKDNILYHNPKALYGL